MLELGTYISNMIFWHKVAIHDLLLAKYHFSNNLEWSLLIQSSDVWINRWKVLLPNYKSCLKSLSIKLTAYNAYSTNNYLVFSCLIFFCCCITYPYAKFFHFKAQLKNIWTASKSFLVSRLDWQPTNFLNVSIRFTSEQIGFDCPGFCPIVKSFSWCPKIVY